MGTTAAILGGSAAAGFGAGMIGRGREAAKLFVQAYQQPFDRRMADIDRQAAAGELDGVKAQEARLDAITRYAGDVESFGSSGPAEARTVADQAIETFNRYYAPNYGVSLASGSGTPVFDPGSPLAGIRGETSAGTGAADAGDAAGEPTTPENAPSMGTILSGEGTTPEARARQAARGVRRRERGNGRQSTILTGPRGVGELPAEHRRVRTILGG